MRLDQLLEQFRRDSDDRAEPFLWSTEDVTDWLNEAEGEACERMRLLRDTRTYPIAAGDSGATAIHAHLFSVLRAWLVDAGGEIYTLEERDELELDQTVPDWRSRTQRPERFIWYGDRTLRFDALADAAYTLHLECWALPQTEFRGADAAPSIPAIHHRRLVYWALHKAYSVPDSELQDDEKAARNLAAFDAYFGRRPTADMRRGKTANNPHRNKLW